MEQLKLSIDDLLKIGFTKRVYPEFREADVFRPEQTLYEIECLNGCFYCDPTQEVYRWYQRITIGDVSNHINLDITHISQLFVIFVVFKVPSSRI